MQIKLVQIGFVALLLSACGGGGSSEDSSLNQPENQIEFAASEAPLDISPGGIWASQTLLGQISTTLFIDETGKLLVEQVDTSEIFQTPPQGFVFEDFDPDTLLPFDPLDLDIEGVDVVTPIAPNPLFDINLLSVGFGQVVSSDANGFIAEYNNFEILADPLNLDISTCEVTGTLIEDASLNLSIDCPDASDNLEQQLINFVPLFFTACSLNGECSVTEPYSIGSSLEVIEGIYTPLLASSDVFINPFLSSLSSPSLEISATGQISGQIEIETDVSCSVLGSISTIDAQFNLYDAELTINNCDEPFANQNGREFAGFATTLDASEGAIIRLMIGANDGILPNYISGTLFPFTLFLSESISEL